MDQCTFCQISKGEIVTHKIYEDEFCFAFLDKHPINPGHTLVIPKHHAPNFYELEDLLLSGLMIGVKKVAKQIDSNFDPHKVGLIIAGWDVPHTHVHVVPMHDYHDITSKPMLEGIRTNPTEEELSSVAEKLVIN